MKILSVLLVTACFSSFAYADMDAAQKKEFILGFKGSLATQCYNDYKAKADQNNHVISDDEKNKVLNVCHCVVDKTVEKMGGEDFVLNNSTADLMAKSVNIMSDKNQMMPIIKECAPRKTNSVN